MLEKLQNSTEGHKKGCDALTTADEVRAFAKWSGIELTCEEAAAIVESLFGDDFARVVSGASVSPSSHFASRRQIV